MRPANAAAVALTLAFVAAAMPQASAQPGGNADAQAAVAVQSPQYFVSAAAQANLLLIQSSQLAIRKAHSDEVKALANLLLQDCRSMQSRLRQVAEAEKLKVSYELEQDGRARLARLDGAAGGADFDKAWLELQRKAQFDIVQLYAAYAKKGDNKALKDIADMDETILRAHQERLQKIAIP